MENIGDLIVEKRKELGLTQAELGAMLGISGKAVSKWERGLSKPCEEHAERLCQLLGLAVDTEAKRSQQKAPTFRSVIKNEWLRILAVGAMIGICICRLAGLLSTESTVVYLGLSTALFCLGTMIQSKPI